MWRLGETVGATQTLALPPVALKWFGIGFVVLLVGFLAWYMWMRGRE